MFLVHENLLCFCAVSHSSVCLFCNSFEKSISHSSKKKKIYQLSIDMRQKGRKELNKMLKENVTRSLQCVLYCTYEYACLHTCVCAYALALHLRSGKLEYKLTS